MLKKVMDIFERHAYILEVQEDEDLGFMGVSLIYDGDPFEDSIICCGMSCVEYVYINNDYITLEDINTDIVDHFYITEVKDIIETSNDEDEPVYIIKLKDRDIYLGF